MGVRTNYSRRGTIYVAVAGVTMVVAVMAAAGMTLARLELRLNETQYQQAEARLLAQSAVEYAVSWVEGHNNHAWRSLKTHNVESAAIPLGRGAFTWKLVDQDSDLNNDATDPVYVVGIGRVGSAIALERVQLEPVGENLTCLDSAFHCQGNVILNAGDLLGLLGSNLVETNQTISSNGQIDATALAAEIDGNAWAVGTIAGSVAGSRQSSQTPPREMPNSHVFDYYLSNGTWINVDDLPQGIGRRLIQSVVLSPNHNPFGGKNPQGIYVIDCQGAEIAISHTRIVGTLVLLNNASDSSVSDAVHWEPAAVNYPALLTENGFELRLTGMVLNENALLPLTNTNFNPAHTPYEGVSNSNVFDEYPNKISGLIYVGGLLRIDGSKLETQGVVVADRVAIASSAKLNFDAVRVSPAPPGFSKGGQMRIIAGTWQPIAAD